MESHLESATRVHLDFACVKLNKTVDDFNKSKNKLKKIEDKFDDAVALLDETMAALKNAVGLLQLPTRQKR